LEGIFEDRVARALVRLGLPTAAELEDLQKRVTSLEAAAAAHKARAPRAAAKKTARAAKKVVKQK